MGNGISDCVRTWDISLKMGIACVQNWDQGVSSWAEAPYDDSLITDSFIRSALWMIFNQSERPSIRCKVMLILEPKTSQLWRRHTEAFWIGASYPSSTYCSRWFRPVTEASLSNHKRVGIGIRSKWLRTPLIFATASSLSSSSCIYL